MYISKEERTKLKESLQNTKQLLTEGIWAFPFDVKTALKLKKFMSKPRSKEEAIDSLYYIFGDDELFDNIQDCIDPLDVRYEIRSRLK